MTGQWSFSTFTIADTGEPLTVWTTFGKTDPSEQINLDVNAAITRQVLTEFFSNFSRNNVKIVRLDTDSPSTATGFTISFCRTAFWPR